MTVLEQRRLNDLDVGQIFLFGGKMYRKSSDTSAQLLRLACGAEPDSEQHRDFFGDDIVDLVPTSDSNEASST